ncbi:OmpL47-type beta-barrel domain-containing protein [Georgenia sp. Z1491]|uniref:OmpL47-type beta-barrel domain-containing protein n=1 Tax=Georgenia sp. Z1491 TaxID=3416707 RepID=UPI003CF8BD23
MRTRTRLATVLLGSGLVISACSDDGSEPDGPEPAAESDGAQVGSDDQADGLADDEHEDHGSHDHGSADAHGAHEGHGDDADPDAEPVDEGPVVARILGTSTGEYVELAEGLGSPTNTLVVEGTATMVMTESGTEITTEANGLLSGEAHPAHLHDGSCADFGGHYGDDPTGPMSPPNEIWLSSTGDPEGSLEPSPTGFATGEGGADWLPRVQPLSMMIHDFEAPGLPIACAPLSAFDAPASVVLEADQDDVDSIEYSLDGGEWQPYADAIVLDEPGSHTVSYAGVDSAGERGEPAEITVEVVDAG